MNNSTYSPVPKPVEAPAKRTRPVKVGTTIYVKSFNVDAVIVAYTELNGRYYVEWSEPARDGAARRGWLFREDFTVRKAPAKHAGSSTRTPRQSAQIFDF